MNRKFVVVVMDKNGKYDCILNKEIFDTRELADKAMEAEKSIDKNHFEYNYTYIVEPIWYE